MPKQNSMPVQINTDPNDPAPFPAYLPLHLFDSEEHDCRLPTEWLQMGQDNGVRKPVPAMALLPSKDADKECKNLNSRFCHVLKRKFKQ